MPPRGHAILSPSSAERWINCPPSALENAKAERTDTVFTREGTLAHAVCEAKARWLFDNVPFDIDGFKQDELWQDEMDGYTDRYVECLEMFADDFPSKPKVFFERQLQFGEYVPESFGTADCIMLDDETIHVIDFKYGKGVEVSAEENPQLMIYALGAMNAYADLFSFNTVKVSIVQPRINRTPSTWSISVSDLMKWAETALRPAASLAIKGDGETKPGDWCRWCCCNGVCSAQFNEFKEAEESMTDAIRENCVDMLTDDEVAKAIELGSRLGKWLDAVKAHAMDICLDGGTVPGWKVVEGRSVRVWSDMDGAFNEARKQGIPDELLYERSPISLTALEKMVGKKKFSETMNGFITKPEGKPTLVSASDKRDPILRKASAEDDFFHTLFDE